MYRFGPTLRCLGAQADLERAGLGSGDKGARTHDSLQCPHSLCVCACTQLSKHVTALSTLPRVHTVVSRVRMHLQRARAQMYEDHPLVYAQVHHSGFLLLTRTRAQAHTHEENLTHLQPLNMCARVHV